MSTVPSTAAKGERVLSCSHDTKVLHWFAIVPSDTVLRSDGEEFECRWVCLCEPCCLLPGEVTKKVTRDFVLDEDVAIELSN